MQSCVTWVYKTKTTCNRGQFVKRDSGLINSVQLMVKPIDLPVVLPPQLPDVAPQENPPAAQQNAEPQSQPVEVRWFYAVFLNILRFLWRPLRLIDTGLSMVLLGILCSTFQISLLVV